MFIREKYGKLRAANVLILSVYIALDQQSATKFHGEPDDTFATQHLLNVHKMKILLNIMSHLIERNAL